MYLACSGRTLPFEHDGGDGECSQLLCWPLVPCPNSCAHSISATGSAGLGAVGTLSCRVLQGKFLCVKYHECWCRVEQCVSQFFCCRNVKSLAKQPQERKVYQGLYPLDVTASHGREGTEPEAAGLVASTVRKQRYMLVLSPPSPFVQCRTPDREWCHPELESSTSVNLT